MADCNPALMSMEENLKLSRTMCADTPEEKAEMANVPYRELVGKLLYLAVATRPDISYTVAVLCRFVESPGSLIELLNASYGTLKAPSPSSSLTATHHHSSSLIIPG